MIGKWLKGKGKDKGKDKGPDQGGEPKAVLPDSLDYDKARELARHEDVSVRLALAARDDIKPEILYYLAEDPSPEVRRTIAGNAAAPMHADLLLARDHDESVRGDLAAKIAKLAPGLNAAEQDRIRKMAYEAIEILARDQAARVRRILSEELKDIADAPPAIIRQLAKDAELIVSEPVLSFSPVLTDEDLIEIIAGNPPQGARSAIARRKNHGPCARARKLRSVQRIGEKRDGVAGSPCERADTVYDDSGVALQVAAETSRELT